MTDELRLIAERLTLDLVSVGVLVAIVLRFRNRSWDFAFACVMLNVTTFSLSFIMNRVPTSLGFGLGLFAIFGILRYRTEAIRIADLTYLFIMIGLAVLHGIDQKSVTLNEVLLLDAALVGVPVMLELLASRRGVRSMKIKYDRTELLPQERADELHADIRERLGLECQQITVTSVDLLRDTADLTVMVNRHEPSR